MTTDRKLRVREAAQYLSISKSTLDKMRCTGEGPVYAKLGPKIVIYEIADLDAWVSAGRRRSTSEPRR